jgi:hypothetical protein
MYCTVVAVYAIMSMSRKVTVEVPYVFRFQNRLSKGLRLALLRSADILIHNSKIAPEPHKIIEDHNTTKQRFRSALISMQVRIRMQGGFSKPNIGNFYNSKNLLLKKFHFLSLKKTSSTSKHEIYSSLTK